MKTASVITDPAGTIKEDEDYYPWGGELQFVNSDSNHYKFTGKERDSETGLDYLGARYYGNWLGRFLTPDWAAKATAIPYAELADPESLNLYAYVRNRPTVMDDPDGHLLDPGDGSPQSGSGSQSGVGTGRDLTHFDPTQGPDQNGVCYTEEYLNQHAAIREHDAEMDFQSRVGDAINVSNPLVSAGLANLAADPLTSGLSKVATSSAESQLAQNAERSAASEARVLKDLGRTKNTEPVVGAEGKSIPDFKDTRTIGEIKDTKVVSNTEQLRIQKEAAQQTGRQHQLHTGTNTHVTKPASQGTSVIRWDDLGPR